MILKKWLQFLFKEYVAIFLFLFKGTIYFFWIFLLEGFT